MLKKINPTTGKPSLPPEFKTWSEATAFQVFEANIVGFSTFLKHSIFDWIGLEATIEGENKISEKICSYFNTLPEMQKNKPYSKEEMYIFNIVHQTSDKGHAVNDMSISMTKRTPHADTPTIFRIEAKRLPTPGTGREKEYVTKFEGGKEKGGIARFKTGAHASELKKSLMIGYIQKDSIYHWEKQINFWISEQIKSSTNTSIIWKNNDKISNFIDINGVGRYQSTHERIKPLGSIELYHYWIKFL